MKFLLLSCLWAGCAAEVSQKARVDSRIQFDMGVENLGKGNYTGALSALTSSETLDPEFADTENALGLTLTALGRYVEAEKHFLKALELNPTYSDVRNNMGWMFTMQGQYDKAIEQFNLALKDVLYITPASAEGNLGYTYYKKGDRVRALKHIKNATIVNPKFCRGYMWLGEIYQASGEFRDAERYLDRFVERCLLDPKLKDIIDATSKSEVYMRLGQVTLSGGDMQRARSAFQECVNTGKETPYFDTCDRGLRNMR